MTKLVQWTDRYSSTMENDEKGRWARVAIAGKTDSPFHERKIAMFNIAWIKKLYIKGELNFVIDYLFPSQEKFLFKRLEDAKKEVEITFEWFISMCTTNTPQTTEEVADQRKTIDS